MSFFVFILGTPFTPLLQLLSVLPPQSGAFLPPSYMDIMTDPISPCVDYYPKDFEVDANGKKVSLQKRNIVENIISNLHYFHLSSYFPDE